MSRRPPLLTVGTAIVAVTAFAALVGPFIAPFDPSAQDLPSRLAGPTFAHPFGLDELGRDILARVLAGAQISFLVGLTVVSISAVVGTMLGAVAGYFGGAWDDVISRVIDTLLAFPGLLLAIALVAVWAEPAQRAVRADDHRVGGLRAAGARAGAARAGIRVCPRVARPRRGLAAYSVAPRHSHRAPSGRRSGDARDGGGDHRGGVAQFSRARRSAADAQLGHDAQRRARAHSGRAAPDDFPRGSRSRSSSSGSISSATACATRPIPSDRDVASAFTRTGVSPAQAGRHVLPDATY